MLRIKQDDLEDFTITDANWPSKIADVLVHDIDNMRVLNALPELVVLSDGSISKGKYDTSAGNSERAATDYEIGEPIILAKPIDEVTFTWEKDEDAFVLRIAQVGLEDFTITDANWPQKAADAIVHDVNGAMVANALPELNVLENREFADGVYDTSAANTERDVEGYDPNFIIKLAVPIDEVTFSWEEVGDSFKLIIAQTGLDNFTITDAEWVSKAPDASVQSVKGALVALPELLLLDSGDIAAGSYDTSAANTERAVDGFNPLYLIKLTVPIEQVGFAWSKLGDDFVLTITQTGVDPFTISDPDWVSKMGDAEFLEPNGDVEVHALPTLLVYGGEIVGGSKYDTGDPNANRDAIGYDVGAPIILSAPVADVTFTWKKDGENIVLHIAQTGFVDFTISDPNWADKVASVIILTRDAEEAAIELPELLVLNGEIVASVDTPVFTSSEDVIYFLDSSLANKKIYTAMAETLDGEAVTYTLKAAAQYEDFDLNEKTGELSVRFDAKDPRNTLDIIATAKSGETAQLKLKLVEHNLFTGKQTDSVTLSDEAVTLTTLSLPEGYRITDWTVTGYAAGALLPEAKGYDEALRTEGKIKPYFEIVEDDVTGEKNLVFTPGDFLTEHAAATTDILLVFKLANTNGKKHFVTFSFSLNQVIAGEGEIAGGGGNDKIDGSDKDDDVKGGGGDDTIKAGDGNDDINGGPGNDRIFGGNGNDTIRHTGGESGIDVIDGGAGIDTLVLGYGAYHSAITIDFSSTERWKEPDPDGAPFKFVKGGIDDFADGYIYQRVWIDLVHIGTEDRNRDEFDYFTNIEKIQVWATYLDDVLIGSDNDDILRGRHGSDVLDGRGGTDLVEIDYGRVTVRMYLDASGRTAIWDADAEEWVVSATTQYWQPVNVTDLRGEWIRSNDPSHYIRFVAQLDGEDDDVDYVRNFERFDFKGGDGDDTLIGGDHNDKLHGGSGIDILHGKGGKDELDGGRGNDIIVIEKGAADNDVIKNFAKKRKSDDSDSVASDSEDVDFFASGMVEDEDRIRFQVDADSQAAVESATGLTDLDAKLALYNMRARKDGKDTIIERSLSAGADGIRFTDDDVYEAVVTFTKFKDLTAEHIEFEWTGNAKLAFFTSSDANRMIGRYNGEAIHLAVPTEQAAFSWERAGASFSFIIKQPGHADFVITDPYWINGVLTPQVYDTDGNLVTDLPKLLVAKSLKKDAMVNGSEEDDYIFGTLADEIIDGKGGSDTLIGGMGNDNFVFNRDTNEVDIVKDFSRASGTDRLRLTFSDAELREHREAFIDANNDARLEAVKTALGITITQDTASNYGIANVNDMVFSINGDIVFVLEDSTQFGSNNFRIVWDGDGAAHSLTPDGEKELSGNLPIFLPVGMVELSWERNPEDNTNAVFVVTQGENQWRITSDKWSSSDPDYASAANQPLLLRLSGRLYDGDMPKLVFLDGDALLQDDNSDGVAYLIGTSFAERFAPDLDNTVADVAVDFSKKRDKLIFDLTAKQAAALLVTTEGDTGRFTNLQSELGITISDDGTDTLIKRDEQIVMRLTGVKGLNFSHIIIRVANEEINEIAAPAANIHVQSDKIYQLTAVSSVTSIAYRVASKVIYIDVVAGGDTYSFRSDNTIYNISQTPPVLLNANGELIIIPAAQIAPPKTETDTTDKPGETSTDSKDLPVNNDEEDNQIFGTEGPNRVRAGAGNDTVNAGDGDDEVYGETGDDKLNGGNGDDELDGGEGNDELDGGNDNDTLAGGPGQDHFKFKGKFFGEDVIIDYENIDVIEFDSYEAKHIVAKLVIDENSPNQVHLVLNFKDAATNQIIDGVKVTLRNLQGVDLDRFNILDKDGRLKILNFMDFRPDDDELETTHELLQTLYGGAGDDTLRVKTGSAYMFGGAGKDRLIGGAGEDQLQGGAGRDFLTGKGGRDVFVLHTSGDNTGNAHAAFVSDFEIGVDRIGIIGSFDINGIEAVAGEHRILTILDALGFKLGFTRVADQNERTKFGYDNKQYTTILDTKGNQLMMLRNPDLWRQRDDTHQALLTDEHGNARKFEDIFVIIPTGRAGDSYKTGAVQRRHHDFYSGAPIKLQDDEAEITWRQNDDGTFTLIIRQATAPPVTITDPNWEKPVIIHDSSGEVLPNIPTFLSGKGPINGQDTPEHIFGDDETDDTINAAGGDDEVYGKGGNDKINGGTGNDKLNGGKGKDTINGGDDNDKIKGGDGSDTLNGDAGKDTIHGENGDDKINGGTGDDELYGGPGLDTIKGEEGNDKIHLGQDGGTASGGPGRDAFIVDKFGTITDFEFGEKIKLEGIDENYFFKLSRVGYEALLEIIPDVVSESKPVKIFISRPTENRHDYLNIAIEASGSLQLQSAIDIVRWFIAAEDTLDGKNGVDDRIYGLGGNDEIRGLSGNDILFGGSGRDTIYGGDGRDQIYGGGQIDTLRGGGARDFLFGGHGDDVLHGDDGSDVLFGGRGDDRLVGGSGVDYFVLQVTEDLNGLDRIVDFEAGIDKIILNMRPTDSEHIKKSHEFAISNQGFGNSHGNYDEFVIRERIADQRNPPIVHIVDGEKSVGQGPEKLLDNVFFFSGDITGLDGEFTDLFVKFIDGL